MFCSLSGWNQKKIAYEKFSHDRNNLFFHFFFFDMLVCKRDWCINVSSIDLALTFNNMLCTSAMNEFHSNCDSIICIRLPGCTQNVGSHMKLCRFLSGSHEYAEDEQRKRRCAFKTKVPKLTMSACSENASNCVHSFHVWSMDECCIQSKMDVFMCVCMQCIEMQKLHYLGDVVATRMKPPHYYGIVKQ